MTNHSYLIWRQADVERHKPVWMHNFNSFPAATKALESGKTFESSPHASALQQLRTTILSACTSHFGFVLLRNFPVEPLDLDSTKDRLARLGKLLGSTLPQDSEGEHLGELSAQTRGPDWYNELPFHTDGSNLLLLLGVQPAASGSVTKLACAAAILETMQSEHPNTWKMLFESWVFHRGNRAGPAYFERPIFRKQPNSTPDCFFLPGTIRQTPEVAGIPLSPERLQVLENFEQIAERRDHHFCLSLMPGDLLVLNNNKVLHARTRYSDDADAPQRLVLRMWVNVEEADFR